MGKNRTIISTFMPEQYEKFSFFLGNDYDLMNFPMIQTELLEPEETVKKALLDLKNYSWIIFTSKRGVAGFIYSTKKLGLKEFKNIKIACIGESTARELKLNKFEVNYINPENTSEEFAFHLKNGVFVKEDKILLIQGERANDFLLRKLSEDFNVARINVYKTLDVENIDDELNDLIDKDLYDLIVFTSPSGFENFIRLGKFKPNDKMLRIASIGAKTTKEIENMGFQVTLTSKKSNLEDLANAIKEYCMD